MKRLAVYMSREQMAAKRIVAAAVLLLALVVVARVAAAQSVPSLLSDLQQARAHYPTPMTDAQRGALLNEVAWAHQRDGWGLLKKLNGAHVPQPKTGTLVAGDILFNRVSGHHYDVLADGEGAATPVWQDDGLNDVKLWVAPVEPTASTPEKPKPPKASALTQADLDRAVAAIEAHDDANTTAVQAQIDQVVNNAEKTGSSIWTWLRPLLLALGGTSAGLLIH